MKLTVIVSTYNAPGPLRLVLDGLTRQLDPDFECLVADDGSTPETAAVVASFRKRLPIIHSWQKDDGFRLAGVRNRALAIASGEIVAFLDGDCIPTPHYVGDVRHWMNQGARIYLQGHRVLLDRELSAALTSTEGIFDPGWIFRQRRHLGNLKNAMRFPWPLLRSRRLHGVRGCHMVFRRADLAAVNGFDEEFVGWGHEDRDLIARLFQLGVWRVDARGRAVVYHLWHPEHNRAQSEENLRRAAADRPIRAARGLQLHGATLEPT